MANYYTPLFPGEKYHVLNRAVGSEKLFFGDLNYNLFLSRYEKYISPIADTYCYSLLPNHFHFLIGMKDEQTILDHFQLLKNKVCPPQLIPEFTMKQFSNFLNSYAKKFNGMYARKGSLFTDYMKRIEIQSDPQFGSTIFYIHKNPVHHGCCPKMEDWKWSSYNTILSNMPTPLLRYEVLEWFGGTKGFLDYHSQPIYLKNAAELE
jgi:REP element-mobilizing transposase RayT